MSFRALHDFFAALPPGQQTFTRFHYYHRPTGCRCAVGVLLDANPGRLSATSNTVETLAREVPYVAARLAELGVEAGEAGAAQAVNDHFRGTDPDRYLRVMEFLGRAVELGGWGASSDSEELWGLIRTYCHPEVP